MVVLLTMTPSTFSLFTTLAISLRAESVRSGAIFTSTGVLDARGLLFLAVTTRRSKPLRCLRPCKFLNPGVFGDEMFTTM